MCKNVTIESIVTFLHLSTYVFIIIYSLTHLLSIYNNNNIYLLLIIKKKDR